MATTYNQIKKCDRIIKKKETSESSSDQPSIDFSSSSDDNANIFTILLESTPQLSADTIGAKAKSPHFSVEKVTNAFRNSSIENKTI